MNINLLHALLYQLVYFIMQQLFDYNIFATPGILKSNTSSGLVFNTCVLLLSSVLYLYFKSHMDYASCDAKRSSTTTLHKLSNSQSQD